MFTSVSLAQLSITRKKGGLPGKEAMAKVPKLACVLLKKYINIFLNKMFILKKT